MDNTCGVYRFKSRTSGWFYVGSSKNVHKRKSQHLNRLRAGTHSNIIFQRVYNKYGEDDFSYSFKLCDSKESALALKQRLLDLHVSNGRKINIGRKATGGNNLTDNPKRDDIIKRIKSSLDETIWSLSAEERLDKYSRAGSKNGMYGKTHSASARDKIAKSVLGTHRNLGVPKSTEHRRKMSENAKARTGAKNPFFGRHHSDETKSKLSIANMWSKPPNCRQVYVEGHIFESLTEAGRQLGVCTATVSFRIKSKYFDYNYVE